MTDVAIDRQEQQAQDLRKLARGSSLNLAGSLVAAVLNLVMPVLITRGLSKDDAGVFFQVTSLFTVLINVGTVGADTGLLRTLPRAIALDKPADVKASMRVSVAPPVLLTTIISTLLVIFAHPLGNWATGSHSSHADLFAHAVMVLAPILPFAVAYTICLSTSRGLGSVKALVFVEKLGRGVLQVVMMGAAIFWTTSALGVVIAWAIPYIVAFIVLLIWIKRLTDAVVKRISARGTESQWAVSKDLARDFWSFSAPRALSRVFSVALQRFDIVIVGALRGPGEAAVYAAATRFPILGLMFVQAIQQVMAPRISEFLAKHDHDRALAIYRTTTCWLTLVSWPIYLLSVSYATLLLHVFGQGYHAPAVVIILCLSMLVATACGPVDSVLLMGGRSVLSLINTGLALTADVVIDLILVPHIGINGAAIGWMVGILVNNLLPLWQVNRILGMHPLGRATRYAMALSLVTFGALPFGVHFLLGDTIASFLIAGVVATALFLAGAVRKRKLLELDAMASALRRRPAKRGGSGDDPDDAAPTEPPPVRPAPGRHRA